jgi:hypothetical protein
MLRHHDHRHDPARYIGSTPTYFPFSLPRKYNGGAPSVDREPFGAPSLPEVLLAKSKRQPNQIVYEATRD